MPPRVAYFPDSFHEVNGVAHTSRNFEAYARRHGLPFLCVRAGKRDQPFVAEGPLQTLELPRGPLAIPLEQDLHFDPFFFRHAARIERTLSAFRPDIVHITGPSELGILGAWLAWKLHVPLAASWHTNVHEYAARRLEWLTRRLGPAGRRIGDSTQAATLHLTSRFYRLAKVLYAPNPGLCALLEGKTGRPCHLMQRGVETSIFTPEKRTRQPRDGRIVLGFVGRLSVEKNVALLPIIDRELRGRGLRPEWLIVGHGAEEAALRAAMPADSTTFAGVLRGDALAQAYANMDLLLFPSHTDTFGNVVLEALASGVPAIVTPDGGPATIVRDGHTGRIATDAGFATATAQVLQDHALLGAMRSNARAHALSCSWDAVFERVYAAYPVSQTPGTASATAPNTSA